MPEDGVTMLKHEDILSFNEIVDFVHVAAHMGITKVRITGGEPLVRKGIVSLIAMIANVDGITDLAMTTNAVLLKQFAQPLFDAGLKRVNISLDTLNPKKFKEITRGGSIDYVIEGIQTAKEVGFSPIKINCVIKESSNEPDALEVKQFAEANGLQVRFIPLMDLNNGIHGIVEGGEGGDCTRCNRLRLTANGMVKPCLFSDIGYNIREIGAREALLKAVEVKPECGGISMKSEFYNIGG
jgi:cyclic pyranopterin phosphate synthase